jgi:hypothetical protein
MEVGDQDMGVPALRKGLIGILAEAGGQAVQVNELMSAGPA